MKKYHLWFTDGAEKQSSDLTVMEKVSLVNQQSTQTSSEDVECTKLLINYFHFLNFPSHTRYHVICSSIQQDKKQSLSYSYL